MLPSLLYAVVRLLLDVALLRCRCGTARDLELLVLRHEVRVLRRRPLHDLHAEQRTGSPAQVTTLRRGP